MTNFPNTIDTDLELYQVHDALRLTLAEDYTPGSTFITVEGDERVMERFPSTGIITLTEQVSDKDERAVSLTYSSKTENTFEGLELLDDFQDYAKPKDITNVTMNVMAEHHNIIKDAVIAIEQFVGIQGTCDTSPFGDTLQGRTCFLRKLALTPRAWFSVDKRVGLVPLCVTFKDESIRLGNGEVTYIWDFGDNTMSHISTICVTSVVTTNNPNVLVQDLDGGEVKKCFQTPGIYDATLTVRNENGEDTITFPQLINARIEAPDEAVIDFIPRTGQIVTTGDPVGGPFTTPPTIRTVASKFIDMEIQSGENAATPGRSYSGELLDGGGTPIDPVTDYTWSLSDDLDQSNLQSARALYTLGGFYDLSLRVDTQFGAYRITTYEDSIDVVEQTNLWLWTHNNSSTVTANEMGLLSETFKSATTPLSLTRDDSFLDGTNNEEQAKREFGRNVHFAPRGTSQSGDSGTTMLYYASGGPSLAAQTINVQEYEGFSDVYLTQTAITGRPWNWTAVSSPSSSYFLFGQDTTVLPNSNTSYQVLTLHNLLDMTQSETSLDSSFYQGPAIELQNHVSSFDGSGVPTNGYFSVYRTTWKDDVGYVLRNDGVGTFFRIKSFYRTDGDITNPVQQMIKLPDMAGIAKPEGELVPLTNGVFFFNNSGSIAAYNHLSGVWETGGPSSTSASFRSLQDTSVSSFDDPTNTLLASSDGDRIAYLSYDYSAEAFIKFNGQDLTFSNIGPRPSGTQFLMGIY